MQRVPDYWPLNVFGDRRKMRDGVLPVVRSVGEPLGFRTWFREARNFGWPLFAALRGAWTHRL